jgi:predicted membrane-bound dolichyl-phosphate-mannose-protein mannosyltransferase
MNKRLLFSILFLILVGSFLYRAGQYIAVYSQKYNHSYWESRYFNSQWFAPTECGMYDPHINPETCAWDDAWYASEGKNKVTKKYEPIGDDGLYAYAAFEYSQGRDPTTLNAEMPPLGKYILGASIVLFGNQNIFALVSGLLVLSMLYLLSRKVLHSSVLAFLPPILFSFEPLFYTQLRAPFLDLLYLFFGLSTFYFLLRKSYIHAMIFLGCMAATKASIATFLTVLITIVVYHFLARKRQELKQVLLYSPISFLTFLTSYVVYFFNGNSFLAFLKVQKWIINFYATGAKGSLTAVWQMLLTGEWMQWWGKTESVSEWSIMWPLFVILFVISLVLLFKKRNKDAILLPVVWVIMYLGFLMFVPIFPRYLLMVLPFIFIIGVWGVHELVVVILHIKSERLQ